MVDKTLKELVTDTTNVSDVIPSEEFSEVIIEEAEHGAKLEGIIAGVDERLDAGDGDTLKVPIFPTLDVSQKSEGTDYTLTDYSTLSQTVDVARYVGGTELSDQSIYEAEVDLVQRILDAIRRGLSDKMDSVLGDQIGCNQASPIDFTPNIEKSLSTASNVYTKIKDIKEDMGGDGYDPDTVIIGYDLERQLIDQIEGTAGASYAISVADGRVSDVLGMDVIVTKYCNGFSGAVTGDGLVSVVDSDVACVEARGKPATFEEERDASKATTEQVVNAYFGFSEVEADITGGGAEAFGIGLITKG